MWGIASVAIECFSFGSGLAYYDNHLSRSVHAIDVELIPVKAAI